MNCFILISLEHVFLLDPGIARSAQLRKARYVFNGSGFMIPTVCRPKRDLCCIEQLAWTWPEHKHPSLQNPRTSFQVKNSHILMYVTPVLFLCLSYISIFFFFFAFSQVVTNCKNTVQGFKRFHGRAFSDPYVQRLKNSLVYDITQMPTGTTGIKVREEQLLLYWISVCLVFCTMDKLKTTQTG